MHNRYFPHPSTELVVSASLSAQIGRILVAAFLFLALVAGTPAAAADAGTQCPPQTGGDNPTRAYDYVPGTAVESSDDGRSTALVASGCIDEETVDRSGVDG